MDLSEHDKVTVSNNFIDARYDMSSLEQKIVLINISTIGFEDTEFKRNMFAVRDLATLMDVSPELLYRELPKICDNLLSKVFEIRSKDGDKWFKFNLLSSALYGNGIVVFKFNDEAKPFLLQLKSLFTSFSLNNILHLDSKYSLRIYQLCKSNSYKKECYYSLEDFKKNLVLTQKSYNQFGNITAKVITPALNEINKKTDITLEYIPVKQGRKVIGLKFIIKEDKQKVIFKSKSQSQKQPKSNKFFNFNQSNYNYDKLESWLTGEEEWNGESFYND